MNLVIHFFNHFLTIISCKSILGEERIVGIDLGLNKDYYANLLMLFYDNF